MPQDKSSSASNLAKGLKITKFGSNSNTAGNTNNVASASAGSVTGNQSIATSTGTSGGNSSCHHHYHHHYPPKHRRTGSGKLFFDRELRLKDSRS